MSEVYRVKQPGDLLKLDDPLPEVDPGLYVLLSIEDTCCLAVAGENGYGQICATSTLVEVEWTDLSLFREMGLRVDPL